MKEQKMVDISIGTAAVVVVLGMGVVFLGLILLMFVVQITSRLVRRGSEKEEKKKTETVVPEQEVKPAPGSAGELKLYDTDPRDAAMIMAIVADSLHRPLNELRFRSIREIRQDDQTA